LKLGGSDYSLRAQPERSDWSLEGQSVVRAVLACASLCRAVQACAIIHPAPLTTQHLDILSGALWRRGLACLLDCWLADWPTGWLMGRLEQ